MTDGRLLPWGRQIRHGSMFGKFGAGLLTPPLEEHDHRFQYINKERTS
jgi:hypothetical protein